MLAWPPTQTQSGLVKSGCKLAPLSPAFRVARCQTASELRSAQTVSLGTVTSSARFKEAIKPIDKTSEAVLALQPVTFRYKHELDPDGIPQFGLIAEEVEKVNPDVVVRDENGKVNTVRYEAVNAMLLNEFLKEHRKVQELKAVAATQAVAITQQQSTVSQLKDAMVKQQAANANQQQQIEELTAGLQKVSAAVALSKPESTQVADNH